MALSSPVVVHTPVCAFLLTYLLGEGYACFIGIASSRREASG